MYPASLLCSLALLSTSAVTTQAATTFKRDQLFQLVVRVIAQPTDGSALPIEGWRVSSDDSFFSGPHQYRPGTLVPTAGHVNPDGVFTTPDTFYVNGTSAMAKNATTVRHPKTAAEQTQIPYSFDLQGQIYAPPGYNAAWLGSIDVSPGVRVYTNSAGQPYFGVVPQDNMPDVGEGHALACNLTDANGENGEIFVYASNGLSAPAGTRAMCADIRLLPQCAGNFTSSKAPKFAQRVPCYANVSKAPIPKLPN